MKKMARRAKLAAKEMPERPEYTEAKRLLRENRDLITILYYNTYLTERSLKVYWWGGCGDERAERLRKINALHKKLKSLAVRHREGMGYRGGDVYSFNR